MKPQLTYVCCGDYWIPDFKLENTEEKPLNKYGRMRRTFLREHRPTQYSILEVVPPSVGGSGSRRVPIGADHGDCWRRIRARTKQLTSLAGYSIGTA